MNTNLTSFDSRDLRKALGSFGTGVTVVTASTQDQRLLGVTVNSFSSVSLVPPIVAWSLSSNSSKLDAFMEIGRFVINVLSVDQFHLSRQFSRPSADPFAQVSFQPGLAGQPILDDCTATIECKVVNTHIVGDHCLFLGQVERYAHSPRRPLLFCQGNYQRGIDLIEPSAPTVLAQRRTA